MHLTDTVALQSDLYLCFVGEGGDGRLQLRTRIQEHARAWIKRVREGKGETPPATHLHPRAPPAMRLHPRARPNLDKPDVVDASSYELAYKSTPQRR